MSIMNGNYNFISSNVKGIKAYEKRLKLFEYRNNNSNGMANGNGLTVMALYFYKKHIRCQMMS